MAEAALTLEEEIRRHLALAELRLRESIAAREARSRAEAAHLHKMLAATPHSPTVVTAAAAVPSPPQPPQPPQPTQQTQQTQPTQPPSPPQPLQPPQPLPQMQPHPPPQPPPPHPSPRQRPRPPQSLPPQPPPQTQPPQPPPQSQPPQPQPQSPPQSQPPHLPPPPPPRPPLPRPPLPRPPQPTRPQPPLPQPPSPALPPPSEASEASASAASAASGGELLLRMTVELGEGRGRGVLAVHLGERPEEVARTFCETYSLGVETEHALSGMIARQLFMALQVLEPFESQILSPCFPSLTRWGTPLALSSVYPFYLASCQYTCLFLKRSILLWLLVSLYRVTSTE